MEEIVPGGHRVGFGYVSAFLVAGERMTLVDAGVPKRGPKLNGAISEAGRGAPLGDVLVTHHHVDHVGSLDAVAPAGVTVWAHPLDARVIRGEIPPPHPATRSFLDRAGVKLVERPRP